MCLPPGKLPPHFYFSVFPSHCHCGGGNRLALGGPRSAPSLCTALREEEATHRVGGGPCRALPHPRPAHVHAPVIGLRADTLPDLRGAGSLGAEVG